MDEINEHKSNRIFQALDRDQLLTIGNLDDFKRELFLELKNYIEGKSGGNPKQWLRSRDVRQLLGISPGTLQNLRIRGLLPYSKIGNIFMYRYKDIVELLESNHTAK